MNSLPSRQRGFFTMPGCMGAVRQPPSSAPPVFDYAAFMSGKVGDAWLATSTHYTDIARTTPANVEDTIASLTGSAGQFNATQSAGGRRFNLREASGKRFLLLDGGDYMQAGANSNWNFLHSSSDGYVCAAVSFGAIADPDAAYTLIATCKGSTANTGIWTAYEDRSLIPINDAYRTQVMRSTAGSAAAGLISSAGVVGAQVDCVIEIEKSSGSITQFVNTTSIGSSSLSSPASGNSQAELFIGAATDGSVAMVGRIYALLVCNSVPGTSDRNAIRADMAGRCVSPPF